MESPEHIAYTIICTIITTNVLFFIPPISVLLTKYILSD
jgi:hypothetical protein